MYSRQPAALLQHLLKEWRVNLDYRGRESTGAMSWFGGEIATDRRQHVGNA